MISLMFYFCRYLVDLTWYEELRSLETGFSTNKHPYDPLCTLMQCYRQHMLQEALQVVVNPRADVNIDSSLSHLEAIDSTNPLERDNDSPYETFTRMDDLAHWWSALVRTSPAYPLPLLMLKRLVGIASQCSCHALHISQSVPNAWRGISILESSSSGFDSRLGSLYAYRH